jgi:hypothetical protein
MTRVPLSELLSTMRQDPSARCRSLSDGFPAFGSGEKKGVASCLRSGSDVTPNMDFHELIARS